MFGEEGEKIVIDDVLEDFFKFVRFYYIIYRVGYYIYFENRIFYKGFSGVRLWKEVSFFVKGL